MAWYDSVGKFAKSAFDFTGIPGLIHDIATSGSNDDPWYVDAVNVVKDVGKIGFTPVRAAVKGLFAVGEASYELGGKVREEIVQKGLELPFMYNRYKNPGETYDQYQQRVEQYKDDISMGQVALSLIGPGKNAAEKSGWYQDFTERHLGFLASGFDIFNEKDREAAFNNQFVGKFASGSLDFTSSMTIDPLFFTGFIGKGAVIAAKAPMLTTLGASKTGIAAIPGSLTRRVFGKYAMTPESMDDILNQALKGEGRAAEDVRFLASTDAKGQYGYWKTKRVTHPDAMSFLFGKAQTEQEVVDTFRAVMLKDEKAMSILARTDDEVATVLDNLTDMPKPYREAVNGKLDGDIIVSPEYNKAVGTYVSRLLQEDDRFRAALNQVAIGANEFRGGTFARGPLAGTARRKAEKYASTFADPEVTIIQKTSLHPTVAIVNHGLQKTKDFFTQFRPSGIFRVNDADSYIEMNAFLKEAVQLSGGTFAAKAGQYADQYLAAVTEGDRLNIIKMAEKDALGIIAPNMSKQEVEKLYAIFDYRRAKAITEHNNRGFLSLFTENGPVIAKVPILERESANIVVAMDLRKLKNGIDSYERVLPSILSGVDSTDIVVRGQKFLNTLDNINDIFKTSVLLRLGYTVRNLTEAQLSMMAKAFALPAVVASGGPAAVERFITNRKVGFNRLIDQVEVIAGRKDDINVLRREVSRLTDQLRAVDMSRKQLSTEVRTRLNELEVGREAYATKLIDQYIEAEKAKGNLVGREEAERIVLGQEIRRLRGVQAELDGVTVYHGSINDTFELDPTRPLATSATPGRAAKYSNLDIDFGLERYISETGRAVPLRTVTRTGPQLTPAAEFGTSEVFAQTPMVDFRQVQKYVRGEFGAQQGQLSQQQATKELNPYDLKNPDVLQRTILRSVIKEPMVVYRGSSEFADFGPKSLNVGDIVEDKGFVSTSKSSDLARAFISYNRQFGNPVAYKIKVPKGHPGLDIEATYQDCEMFDKYAKRQSEWDDVIREKEVLLPAGTKYKVVNIENYGFMGSDEPINVITLEAITPKVQRKPFPTKLENAAELMKADMIDASRAGNVILVRKGTSQNFVKVSEDTIRAYSPKQLERAVFRVSRQGGTLTPVRVYGDPLYMSKWSDLPVEAKAAFNGDVKVWRAWVKTKGWQDKNHPIYQYLRDNNYGRMVVPDDKRAGGLSTIVLPESIGEVGRGREVSKITKQMELRGAEEAIDTMDISPRLSTPAERRAARVTNRRFEKSRRKSVPVSPYYDKESLTAMLNNGVEDAASQLGRNYAEVHALLDDAMERLGARISAAESNAIKQRLGYGTFQYDAQGHTYELNEAFNNASWFLGRTSAEPTWNSFVGSQQMAFMTGIGSRTMRPVKPNDPRYYEAWSGVLNLHFRDPETGIMDPVVRRILDGETDDEILRYLAKSYEGRLYVNNTYTTPGRAVNFGAIRRGEADDYILKRISDTRQAVRLYIPDSETATMLTATREDGTLLTGGDIEQFLIGRFGSNPEALPEINGLLVTTSKEYRDQERIVDTINRRVMRFLGSLPEDTFARHPLVNTMYKYNLQTNIDYMSKAKGGERLTAAEINRAEKAAREEARREVERTLFTIVRRTGASSSQVMRLLFPFYSAYENTLMRWGGIAADNPQVVTTAARTIAQVVNGQLVVDKEGNRITSAADLQNTDNANLVVQVPPAFLKALPGAWQEVAENAFKTINIPLKSLDVITQGEIGNPGFGPYAVLPTYLIVRQRPEFEDAFKPLFPAGLPNSATDIFAPSVIRRLKSMWTKDELYVRTFNQMLRYETYNYNTGKRTDAPTVDEITDKTNKFYQLRALTAISAPFAITPELDFYQRIYRQFQNQYTEPGEAEAKFFEMYPDFFEATVSLSKNPGGLEANLDTVRNLRKFSGLMAEAEAAGEPELMGWLANDFDGKYDFSQAAYQWQYRSGSYPGSASTYRSNRNPAELIRDANLKRGWVEYRKIQDMIDTYKIQNGISSNRDPLLQRFNDAKRGWLDIMATQNPDWYAAYMSPDRGKYMKRAGVLELAFQDMNWMQQNGDRPVVKAVALYLDARKKLSTILLQRDRAGGSRSLDAVSNQDLSDVWDKFVTQLGVESPEFSDFYNRYFPNDPVVL